MKRRTVIVAVLLLLVLTPGTLLLAQLGGAHWLRVPVSEDPGIAWMVMTDNPDYRVLRVFAAPGATRRMHHHADATWHIITLATGKLSLTIEGQQPVEISAGQSVPLKGGVMHTFTNTGNTLATIVEVFGKAQQ